MRVLGLDTATSIASVGCIDEHDGTCRERALPMSGSHARTLLPLLDALLADLDRTLADLDLIAVSIGPGSFTGLRIGLAAAKGLALATGLPLVAVPTLTAYAAAVGPRPGLVWPLLDARKGEIYAAAFAWQEDRLLTHQPAAACDPAAVARVLAAPCTLVGDGVDAYAAVWAEAAGGRAERLPLAARPPSGVTIAQLGADQFRRAGAADIAALEPSYCRRSEAEVMRDRLQGVRLSVG